MKLVLEDYKKITLGCAKVAEENGKIRFHRFTENEEIFYKERDTERGSNFSARCAAPAGVKLRFATDSKSLKIAVTTADATSRSYFSFDIFENGKLLERVKALVPILVPLFISAFRRADELATAMECRCYQGGDGRSKMKLLRFCRYDFVAFPVVFALLGAVIALSVFGL